MPIHRVGYRIRGFDRVAALGHRWENTPQDAQRRLAILRFWDTHGLDATRDAFGVSRRTLYRWKKALREADFNPAARTARSSAPQRRRQPRTDPRLGAEIRRLRTLYPNLGKDKLHVLRRPWCEDKGLPLPSASTIGRIVGRAPDKMRFAPARLDFRGRVKPLRRHLKSRKPQGVKPAPLPCLATDTLERVRDGIRRDLISFIDPASAFASAVALPGQSPRRPRPPSKPPWRSCPSRSGCSCRTTAPSSRPASPKSSRNSGSPVGLPTPKTPKMMFLPNASIAPFRNPSSTIPKTCCSPISSSSTGNSPTDGCSTTPGAPTIVTVRAPSYNSSSRTNPSAIGGGRIRAYAYSNLTLRQEIW